MSTKLRTRGFSLIEFMIAITIGLFLIAGLVYLIAETSRSRAEIERSSRQIENGRYALDRIAEDLRHAGFFSEFYRVPVYSETGFPALMSDTLPCATSAANLKMGMPIAVQAYDGGGSVPSDLAGCLDSNDYQPNTDILVVRRASTSAICPTGKSCPTTVPATPSSALLANQPYLQGTPAEYVLDVGSNTAAFSLTQPGNTAPNKDSPLRRYVVRIYFISKCNVPASGSTCNGTTDDGGTPIPTLKMLELGVDPTTLGGPQFNKLAIAEGIEHLQIDFGIDDTPSAASPATGLIGDGVTDRIEAPSTAGVFSTGVSLATKDWSNVVAAQVYIVARNTERSPGYADDKTYDRGIKGYTTATNDAYRRHAYNTMVRLNNAAMRRE